MEPSLEPCTPGRVVTGRAFQAHRSTGLQSSYQRKASVVAAERRTPAGATRYRRQLRMSDPLAAEILSLHHAAHQSDLVLGQLNCRSARIDSWITT